MQPMTPHPTTPDPALTLAQWFSPGFPIGAFAYSHGLECVIADGALSSAHDLHTWVEAILIHGTGRNDAIFLRESYGAATEDDVAALDALCLAYCSASGRRVETQDQGAAFCRTLAGLGQADLTALTFPVAVGRAAALNALPLDMTLRFYLQAFAANLISAAVRRVPLGQTEGQQVLLQLQSRIEDLAQNALTLTSEDLHSTAFAADIAAMRHDTLYSKVFRT